MISFLKEHLLFQIMIILSFVMTLYMTCNYLFNKQGQDNLIEVISSEQYQMLASSIMERMNEYFPTGKNDPIREYLKRLKKSINGMDILIFDSKENITISDDSLMEGRPLSSVVKERSALESVRRMISDKKTSLEHSFELSEGKKYIYIFIPINNGQGCITCHDKAEDVIGGSLMMASLERPYNIIKSINIKNIFFGITGLGVVLIILYLMFQRFINRPIGYLLESTGKLRGGDFTHRIEITGRDEISHICARMNLVNENLRRMISDVLNYTDALASSSIDFLKISREMSLDSKQTSDMVDAVTASSEGMNLNIKTIAGSIEQTFMNVTMVASSTEEMTATIKA